MTNYTVLNCIGKGSYSKVYQGLGPTGESVAIKKAGDIKLLKNEYNILKSIDCKNIVSVFDFYKTRKHGHMVMECIPKNLYQVLTSLNIKRKVISLLYIKKYMYGILNGINTFHQMNIVHGDIKPANLLTNQYDIIKICDLSNARDNGFVQDNDCEVYTRWYRAPELACETKLVNKPIDIWAAGCIFCEMILGTQILPGDNKDHQLHLIEHHILINKDEFMKKFHRMERDGRDLIEKMLMYEPDKRITAKDALEHPYFDNLA